MITSEQKDLCVKLYLEGCHTIKDIIEQTGLKYAPTVYQVLDEAGIPRKRKFTTIEKVTETISIEESRMRFLSGLCRLYHNEPENPYEEDKDSFKRYMWRNEWKILQDSSDPKFIKLHNLDDPRSWSSYFDKKIRAYLELWTNPEKGENPRYWRNVYLSFKK